MKDFADIPNTSGSFPAVIAVTSSGPYEDDGTPMIAEWIDSVWLTLQAVIDNAGDTPDGEDTGDQYIGSLDAVYSPAVHDHAGVYAVLAHDHAGVYSPEVHNHDSTYSAIGHNHTGVYALLAHDHNLQYSDPTHNHNGLYSALAHDHSGVYAVLAHDHSGVYAASGHNHTGVYAPVTHHHTAEMISLPSGGNITYAGSASHIVAIVPDGNQVNIASGCDQDGLRITVKLNGTYTNGIEVVSGVGNIIDLGSTTTLIESSYGWITFAYVSDRAGLYIVGQG